jgi:hypothetical protein
LKPKPAVHRRRKIGAFLRFLTINVTRGSVILRVRLASTLVRNDPRAPSPAARERVGMREVAQWREVTYTRSVTALTLRALACSGVRLIIRSRFYFFFAALAAGLASHDAHSQAFNPDTLNIPSTHPRILFTSATDLSRARTWYASNATTPSAGSAIDQAYVGLMTQNATNCRNAINLVLNNANYQLAATLADPLVVASDGARSIGEEAMVTYDWCHAHFTASERATFKTRWNDWVTILNAKPWGGRGMEDNNYYWGYMRNSMLMGLATWGENTVAGVDKAREFLMHGYATRFLDWLVSYYPHELAGGVPPEGTAYGRVMFDYHLLPFLTLRNLGEDPFNRVRFWKESIYYTAYSMTPAKTAGPTGRGFDSEGVELCYQSPPNWTWQQFPFADDERFSQCGYSGLLQEDYSNGMLTYANLFADRDSGKLARLIRNTTNQQPSPWLRAYFADSAPASNFSFNQLPLDYFAPASRSVYMRSVWDAGSAPMKSSLSFMLGRSPAAGHKHYDAGNFQWWRNGRWLSRESTGYVGAGESVAGLDNGPRVDVNHPAAHNTVLFEGRANINGSTETPGAQRLPEGNTEMLRLYANTDFVYGAADLVKGYRYRQGPNRCRYDWPYAQNAVREWVYFRAIETMVLIDRLTGSSDSTGYPPYGTAVNCFQNMTGPRRTASEVVRHVVIHGMETFSQSGSWYLSASGNERLAIQSLLPASRNVTVVNERNAASGGGAQGNVRLDIRASGAATIEFVNVLHASGSSATLPTVTLLNESNGDRSINIVKDGVTHSVRFQLGALPQSTSIAIGGASVTPPAIVAPLSPPEFNPIAFDIDGNGLLDAHTDGILIARYMLGLTGDALFANALGPGATRTTATAISSHLATLHAALDVDGDNERRAATDAVVIARYLRGVRGSVALYSGAVNGNARTPEQMTQQLQTATMP